LPAAGVGTEQRAVAQQVDAPGHTTRQLEDAVARLAVEWNQTAQASHRQPVLDVVRRLLLGQRVEVEARHHPLRELLQFGLEQHVAQLGLADQDDLQQLALVGLQVGQQAQLLQHVDRQVLRLVDDQHVVQPRGVGAQQEFVERVDMVL